MRQQLRRQQHGSGGTTASTTAALQPPPADGLTTAHLDLEGLLQLLDDRLPVLQLQPQPLRVGDLSPKSGRPQLSRWGGLQKGAGGDDAELGCRAPSTALPAAHPAAHPTSHLALRPVSIVFSLLHGRGHLVHGGNEDAAGLAQALVGVDALSAVDLRGLGGWAVQGTLSGALSALRPPNTPLPTTSQPAEQGQLSCCGISQPRSCPTSLPGSAALPALQHSGDSGPLSAAGRPGRQSAAAHLLAGFEGQVLQLHRLQPLVLSQRGDELRSGGGHLLQHGHHPGEVLTAVQQRVRHLRPGRAGREGGEAEGPPPPQLPGTAAAEQPLALL